MKDLKDIRNVYFIGIGGIGMSALARYFKSAGAVVSGYDKTRTPLTDELSDEGITVLFADEEASVDPAADWVIYTPAIPAANKVLGYYKSHDFPLLKRSDVLGKITADTFNICIAGTHGKTTITTLTAHILRHSGYGSNAFLGGISVNYNTNFWSSDRPVSVVEADEYDRSFLKLNPNIAVITAMDPDHLDIYGTAEAMEEAFIDFSARIRSDGWLLSKYGLARGADLKGSPHLTYHLTDTNADVHTSGLTATEGTYTFDVVLPAGRLTGMVLHIGGLHNVENTLAAVAVAHSLGISKEAIMAAVADFKGVRRRFEYVLRTPEVVLVDDYAHHPEELRALISGAKGLFGDREMTVIFQPHLFTRTRDLADGFAESLDLADEVKLLPIYPARELPIEGVSSEMILNRMRHANAKVISKEELLDWADTPGFSDPTLIKLGVSKPRLIIMAGAGDIDALVHPVAEKAKGGSMKIGLSYGKARKVLVMALWFVVAGGCAFLLVAAIRHQNQALCKGVRITIEGKGKWMVDSTDIRALLTDQHTRQLVGTPAESISIKRLEKKINASPWVKSAQLFFDSKQVLWVRVTEREPVARVFTNEGNSFYVDSSGARLPLKDYYPTRLPVFTSCPLDSKHYSQADTLLIRQMAVLSAYLVSHPFWMDMVEQVDLTPDGEFELVPAIGDEVVKLGDTSALDNKFRRLWVFYKNVCPKVGWNKYAALDVRFEGEVIGVKKEAGSQSIDTAAASAMLRSLLDQSKTAMQDTVVRNVEAGRNFLVPDIDSTRDLSSMAGESAATAAGPMLGAGIHMGTTHFATTRGHKPVKGHPGSTKTGATNKAGGGPKALMPPKTNKKK